MPKNYYTYRICLNNNQRIQIEKFDDQPQSLRLPPRDFGDKKKQEEIKQLLEIAHNNQLDKKQTRQLGEALFDFNSESDLAHWLDTINNY